ncbi:MAG: SRPBCC domain-containing protein [Chloroflexi bacterium]|nr:SRPBCC domain-containing protein [Chloroflexota bacterium]
MITQVVKMDPRVGGVWQYVVSAPDGTRRGVFRGKYKESVPFQKLVYTMEFEPCDSRIHTKSATLEEQGSKTLLTVRLVYAGKDDRDRMIRDGMESGKKQSCALIRMPLLSGKNVLSVFR